MATILDEILKKVPNELEISDSKYEGANIVLYTKNKSFFVDNGDFIRRLVNEFKKRIEIRADPTILMDLELAEDTIKEVLPEESGVSNIIFDPQRSRVIIEAEKPGSAIGKKGELLKEIKEKTMWVPLIKRTPPIKSKLIENIRHVLYTNDDYRKKFLDKVGRRIYGGWKRDRKSSWIRVSVLGAGREVGRSCIFLQTSESRVLIDCGINVAANDEKDAYPFFEAPEFNIQDLDAVIVSHSHLDHAALIPLLYKYGYKGPVYMTAPVRDISSLLCLDYIGINDKEGNKKLYSATEVKDMVKHTICLNYEEVTDITPDVRLTLYNAGHTLGSAMIHLNIGNGQHNLLYTGDMNFEFSNLLSRAETSFPRLESCIIEATYASKDEKIPSRAESEQTLVDEIKKTIERGGKVLLPVLGVGRSQEVMLILEKTMREKHIPEVPIFVHGSVWDVTAIHTAYPDFFNKKVKSTIFHKDHNPFLEPIFKQVGSQKEMKQVIEETGPCIIMATSGMMVGGPSVEYFKALADNNKNSIILTSYQGEGSLGRRLQNGEKAINMASSSLDRPEVIEVKCDIITIRGFSGHSDFNQLLGFIRRLNPRPKKLLTVHGEKSRCIELASTVYKQFRIESSAPKNLESVRLK